MSAASTSAATSDILLVNGLLLDVVAGAIVGERDVLVRDGRIAEIGDPRLHAPSARRINLAGRVLMPGLCDAHVHVIVPMNSFLLLTKWSPFYAAIRALPILRDMLMRGFTTVRDAGGADFGLVRAVEEGLIPAPRILHSGKALSQTGGHGDMRGAGENAYDPHYAVPSLGGICNGVAAVREAARDEIRRGARQVKIMAGGGIASYTDPIANDQFSEEEIRAAVEEAEMANIYVMAHTYTARQVTRAVRCGVARSSTATSLTMPPPPRWCAATPSSCPPSSPTVQCGRKGSASACRRSCTRRSARCWRWAIPRWRLRRATACAWPTGPT